MTAKEVEFLTIINRVSQCTAIGSSSKQTFPHNELLILPLLLQATIQCALGFVVTSVPIQKYNQASRMDACHEMECQGRTVHRGDLDSQLPLKSSQHGPHQQESKHYLSGLCTKSCPVKWFTVSFRVPDAFRWLEGHFLPACLSAAAVGLARMVWNT